MSEWQAKRFWSDVVVHPEGDEFAVHLDQRSLKTPAKNTLVVPTRQMAEALAAEWAAVEEKIDPTVMPVTRAANAALDKVAPQFDEVVELIAAYGDSDLLCYRSDSDPELTQHQAAQWDPFLDWGAQQLNARLVPVGGVMHVAQDPDALRELHARVADLSPFELTGFHDLVALSGSLILGFSVFMGYQNAAQVWPVAQLDEIWQAERWGQDEEAQQQQANRQRAFVEAERFIQLCQSVPAKGA